MAFPLILNVVMRLTAEVFVDDRDELIQGILLSSAPFQKQFRDVLRGLRHSYRHRAFVLRNGYRHFPNFTTFRKEFIMASRFRLPSSKSCQAKRAILFGEKLTSEIIAHVPHPHWTFSIPRVLRGLFERERSLLGLLSRTAYEAVRVSFQALWNRKDVRPDCVVSLQTFEAFGANFNPHCHALISDGVFTRNGQFLQLPFLEG